MQVPLNPLAWMRSSWGARFPFSHGGSFLGVCSAQCPSPPGEDAVSGRGTRALGLQELTSCGGDQP